MTVLRALPDDPAEGVPHLAVHLAYLDALAVAVVIVWVIHNAARASQVGRLIDQITTRAVATIGATHPRIVAAPDPPHRHAQLPPRADGRTILRGPAGGSSTSTRTGCSPAPLQARPLS